MTDEEILQQLTDIAHRYYEDNWPLYDLQCDLEELFDVCRNRKTINTSKPGER